MASPARKNAVTLRSISGKSVTLPPPVTLAAVLSAATQQPFCFARETVKVHLHNRLVNLYDLEKKRDGLLAGDVLPESAFAHRMVKGPDNGLLSPRSRSSSPSEAVVTPSVIVYGVPQRVRAALRGEDGPETAPTPSPSATGDDLCVTHGSTDALLFSPTAPRTASSFLVDGGARKRGRNTAGNAHHRGSHNPAADAREVSRSPYPASGPIPFPHSPSGLQALAEDCYAPLTDEDELSALLHGAPTRVYNNPTMRYMARKVKGNLSLLQAMLEQIARVAPLLFAWITENVQSFLSALNQGSESAVEKVREQLHFLAVQAMAEQLSGAAPSPQVMMLTVNTREWGPQYFQLLVHVGDGSERSTPNEDFTSASEYDSNLDEEGVEFEESSSTNDEEAVSTATTPNEGTSVLESDLPISDEREPHRGAILLENKSTPPTVADSLPTQLAPPTRPQSQLRQGLASSSGDASGPLSLVLGSPIDVAEPVTARRTLLTPSPPPLSASTGSTRPRVKCSSLPQGPAGEREGPVEDGSPLSQGSSSHPRNSEAKDVSGCTSLRDRVGRVESLILEWVTRATPECAQNAHRALIELRPTMVNAVKDAARSALLPTPHIGTLFDFRRLVLMGCRLSTAAEEFYVQLDEQGMRSAMFGEKPHESIAALALTAALDRLLFCDIAAVVELHAQQQPPAQPQRQHSQQTTSPTTAVRSQEFCDVPSASPPWKWLNAAAAEQLVVALLQLCRQQRAVVVWYTSHYVMKAVGKTIQTMAYVLGGTEEVQQPVSVQRLKLTSKAHKQDEVAESLAMLAQASHSTGSVPDQLRQQWKELMVLRYQQLVHPLENDLPAPYITSNPLYVCDTRHILPLKEGSADLPTSRSSTESAARWWPGYLDQQHAFCTDKWCVATTARLWNLIEAADSAAASANTPCVAVVLNGSGAGTSSSTIATSSATSAASVSRWMCPSLSVVEAAASPSPPQPYNSLRSAPYITRHSAVLYEAIPRTASAVCPRGIAGVCSARRLLTGDLHVVDISDTQQRRSFMSPAVSCSLVSPYLSTMVRNFVFPSPPNDDSGFLGSLFGIFAEYPRIPVAAAVGKAVTRHARTHDAPWRICEYVLCDYGGPMAVFHSAAVAAAALTSDTATSPHRSGASGPRLPPLVTPAVTEVMEEQFMRMPSVPLAPRRSSPRPLPLTSCPPVPTAAGCPLATAPVVAEEMSKRQYARTHGIDELYKMMLDSLVRHQPVGEANVLDHLVQYVETSEDAMWDKVRARQAEARADDGSSTAGTAKPPSGGSHPKPHPPSGKRDSHTFPRRKQ